MRAMQLITPGDISTNPLKLVECENPKIRTDEILLKVDYCGVCHTDLHIAEGELNPPLSPIIPGHQIVGTVAEVGSGVSNDLIGKRMGMPWVYQTCGHCPACARNEENLCSSVKFTGYDHNGGYAEYFKAPVDHALSIPGSIQSSDAALLMCAGIIGYRSLRCADLKPGEKLGLVGFGASAHLAIQVARAWGCDVWVFTRSEIHRQNAHNLGAHWVGGIDDNITEQLDRAVIFAPVGSLVPKILEKMRPGGTLAINAVYMSDIPEIQYKLLYGERVVRSVANATRQDGYEFLDLAAKENIRPKKKLFPLEDANQALYDLKHSKLTGGAVLSVGK